MPAPGEALDCLVTPEWLFDVAQGLQPTLKGGTPHPVAFVSSSPVFLRHPIRTGNRPEGRGHLRSTAETGAQGESLTPAPSLDRTDTRARFLDASVKKLRPF